MFQFTHPRGVRRFKPTITSTRMSVSIHAPTRGATRQRHFLIHSLLRFNSRTHAGCDSIRGVELCRRSSFNSRTHAGCDRLPTSPLALLCWRFNSRTHAGCDLHIVRQFLTDKRFNSRTHAGCDFPLRSKSSNYPRFQFTHPRGVRRGPAQAPRRKDVGFNSRTHAGCD